MQNHLMFMTRFFMGVYRPHPAKALLTQDLSIPDVHRSRQICISSMSAGHTKELQTNTVSLSNMTASWALLGRVGRINYPHTYTLLGKLIACLELQGRIWPPTYFFPKIFPFFQGCFSNIAKVLEHDHPSIRLNSIRGQGFRSNLQKMFRNGPFAVCQSLQKAMGRPVNIYRLLQKG